MIVYEEIIPAEQADNRLRFAVLPSEKRTAQVDLNNRLRLVTLASKQADVY